MTIFVIRTLDIIFSLTALVVGLPLLVILALIGYFDTGHPLFKQIRVGRNKVQFTLVKFRSMNMNTASVASHLACNSEITTYGKFLRRSKLDELPQLWNVLVGDMSLIGPRPCLFNQDELIDERTKLSIFKVRPGISGLAQIRGIDMSTPHKLAQVDAEMIKEFSLLNYTKLIILTIKGKGSGDAIKPSAEE
ncbi:MAG: O-antigen biosynthesis protein WbqP [Alteromonadaceae bacterium]|jgi:O-antigen biosynthesis protein WbqP